MKKPPINRFGEANKDDEALHQRIAEKAYELYQQRGHTHGCDLDDWLEAERLLFSAIRSQAQTTTKKPRSRRRKSKAEQTS